MVSLLILCTVLMSFHTALVYSMLFLSIITQPEGSPTSLQEIHCHSRDEE